MDAQTLYDFTPVARMALLGIVIALGPLAWVWLRHRSAAPAQRLAALTLLTLFLTFDLILFGAFTRLTDSGLGCPDWPGCYGSASPFGAHEQISAAQAEAPTGPVTHQKAWIEMVHRYLATGVGVLITVMAIAAWLLRREIALSPWWATVTLAWVCVQGAFGALTVTWKLYPAIVTAHLLGGLILLALLAAQAQVFRGRRLPLVGGVHLQAWVVFLLVWVQVALGGWVSTNYAVLACGGFPTCNGSWWPEMDFDHGYTLLRELGAGKDGGYLPFPALVAIHYTHRLAAYVVFVAVGLLAWRLLAVHGQDRSARRFAWALAGCALWQLGTGLSNVVLGWPLVAAVSHTGGAAALVGVLTALLTRARLTQAAPDRLAAAAAGPRLAS
ncbi:COX15/CtaA family protein [Caldimonas thermodepolymerans]|uniref:Cytochrome c oxidase assembly protein subunit 15 n=1 Tax=Caldimonas thermodepolymerans TaxID=215580 RepID=A0AA46DGJ5_9BURK|nr:COX15/CtaA family protein [Caldimonas thermodepolymerans]TCP09005.1 cytochrome c oxidase assembly protein subunit 15 [Caldimonas thermodepolymerans]UZG47305.1 COX15/CtaA family protein [Caldimonas thermodepolymerans]